MDGDLADWLKQARREHRAVLERLSRLERLAERSARSNPAALGLALDRFFRDWEGRIALHMADEARVVGPRLAGSSSTDTGALEAFRRERETVGALMDLLHQCRAWLAEGASGSDAQAAATIRDLSSLWHLHMRRVDVLGPLLEKPEDAAHG